MKNTGDKAHLLRNLVALLFLAITFLTIGQVFFRFVLNDPLVWSEELVRFLLVWMSMIGAAVISYDDRHLSITSFVELFSPTGQFIFYIFRQILVLIFCGVIVFTSTDMVKLSHQTLTGALSMPFSYWRVAAPVGAALIFIYTIIRFIEDLKLYNKGLFGISATEEGGREE